MSVFGTGACVDASERFEDFVVEREQRLANADAGVGDSGTASGDCLPVTAGLLDGDYVLAFVAPIGPDQPVFSRATFSVTGDGDVLDLRIELQPLDFQDLSSEIGEPSTLVGTIEDGRFSTEVGGVLIAPEANTLARGLEALAEIMLEGELCVPAGDSGPLRSLCGSVSGDIVDPLTIVLDGSTFGAVRIDEDGSVPDVTPSSCAELEDL